MSGNALSGGEWTRSPGCHPGRWQGRIRGWGRGAQDSHFIGFSRFEMNGQHPERGPALSR